MGRFTSRVKSRATPRTKSKDSYLVIKKSSAPTIKEIQTLTNSGVSLYKTLIQKKILPAQRAKRMALFLEVLENELIKRNIKCTLDKIQGESPTSILNKELAVITRIALENKVDIKNPEEVRLHKVILSILIDTFDNHKPMDYKKLETILETISDKTKKVYKEKLTELKEELQAISSHYHKMKTGKTKTDIISNTLAIIEGNIDLIEWSFE